MNQADWRSIIRPALAESVPAAEKKITSHPAVQEWLQEASYEAAAGLMGTAGRSGMNAYHQLSNDFEREFDALGAAVEHLTHDCGSAVVDWEPGEPQHAKIRIDFRQEFRVHFFAFVDGVTESSAAQFLDRLASFLPKGAPFPKKPHRVGGVLASADKYVGVRVVEIISRDEGRQKYVTLHHTADDREERIPYDEAAGHVSAALGDVSS